MNTSFINLQFLGQFHDPFLIMMVGTSIIVLFSNVLSYYFPTVYYFISPINTGLFNLQHAQARNVIEQIFGVLKPCFSASF